MMRAAFESINCVFIGGNIINAVDRIVVFALIVYFFTKHT